MTHPTPPHKGTAIMENRTPPMADDRMELARKDIAELIEWMDHRAEKCVELDQATHVERYKRYATAARAILSAPATPSEGLVEVKQVKLDDKALEAAAKEIDPEAFGIPSRPLPAGVTYLSDRDDARHRAAFAITAYLTAIDGKTEKLHTNHCSHCGRGESSSGGCFVGGCPLGKDM